MSVSARELLARRVRELRREKGWSQEDLAVASNLHRTYIGTVERAEQSITVDSIEKLATALDVPVAKLFELQTDA